VFVEKEARRENRGVDSDGRRASGKAHSRAKIGHTFLGQIRNTQGGRCCAKDNRKVKNERMGENKESC
jgi:hypothetical protein